MATGREDLLTIYHAALKAVDGRTAVRGYLQQWPIATPCTLIAVGKAAEAMALGAVDVLGGQVRGGLLISKPGHLDAERWRALGLQVIEAGHPLPTQQSLDAGRDLLHLLQRESNEHLLFLISGGSSSLLEYPVAGLSLADLERAGQWLLGSGLAIEAVNQVRKSLSLIKGGGLLKSIAGRQLTALAISDVPGDDAAVIGSGLLTPDRQLAEKVRTLTLPAWLRDWVERGVCERGEDAIAAPEVQIVASLSQAKAAASWKALELGYRVAEHKAFVDGEAGEVGARLAQALRNGADGVHVWGGETTVRLPDQPGRGGRNQHLALAAALQLADAADCCLLSAGTDGSDGPTEEAGALVDGGTVERVLAQGLDPRSHLERADSGAALEAAGDLLHTGPTGSNVMDLVLGLKQESS